MRVLLALDGSESSKQARDLVVSLPWQAGTAIHVLAAYELPVDWVDGIGAGLPWIDDAEEALRGELTAELTQLASPFEGRSLQIERHVVKGRPASAILQTARNLAADLIVVGSRGRGPLASLALGSVSAEVVDQAPCPVLVARRARAGRLLVAGDDSNAARSIPDVIGPWGVFRGVPTESVSVAPEPERTFEFFVEGSPGADRITTGRTRLVERHRQLAADMAARLAQLGLPATPIVLTGQPGHEIVSAAQRHGVDLIVTGTHGRRGVERLLLGSVARNVLLHAPCSVLVVGGGAAARAGASTPAAEAGSRVA